VQAVRHRLPIASAGFKTELSNVGFVVDKATLGQVFSQYFGFPYQSFTPPIAPQIIIIYHPELVCKI
jgi:hypothetical protein